MIELHILGSLDLRDSSSGNGIQSILAGPKRVAILAYLAVAAPRGLKAREKLLALMALERDEEVADEFELLVVSDNPLDPVRIRGELMAHGYTELANRAAARVVEILDGTPATDRDDDWKYFRATFLMNGRTAEAQSLLEEIPADSPRYLDALGFLGELAAKRGEREEALRISTALEAIGQASLRYEYQAIIAAELGDRERAVSLLRQNESPPRGYMHREMGFPTLRDYPPFLELERPRG